MQQYNNSTATTKKGEFIANNFKKILLLSCLSAINTAKATEQGQQPLTLTLNYDNRSYVDNTTTSPTTTVIDKKQITNSNATDLASLLSSVAGLSVASSGSRGAVTSIFIRGSDSNQVAVYIDGIKVNNPAAGSSYDFSTLSLNQIENIEIIKGGNSIIYGSDAIGGVINITTKSGKYANKKLTTDVDVGYGSYDARNANVNMSGKNANFYYSVGFSHDKTRGISATNQYTLHYTDDNGKQITTGGATENDGFESNAFSLRLGYDFNNAGVDATYHYISNHLNYDNGGFVEDNTGDPRSSSDNQYFRIGGYINGDTAAKTTHRIYYTQTNIDNEYHGQYGDSFSIGREKQLTYQFDYLQKVANLTHQFITIADYNTSEMNAYNGNNSINRSGVAMEYQILSDAGHYIRFGTKYDHNQLFKDSVNAQISGNYQLKQQLGLFANLGTANKNPTLEDLYGFGGTYIGNPNLKPETSVGGDIGFKINSANKAHTATIDYFYRELTDAITVYYDNNGNSYSDNIAGKSIYKGIELTLKNQWTNHIYTGLNYTYLDAHDANDQPLIRRPKHQASFIFGNQITDKLLLKSDITYVGERKDDYYDDTTYSTVGVKMPEYFVVNAGLNYQYSKNTLFYANLNNIFNKHYEEIIGYSEYGRNVYMGVRSRF